MADKPNAPAGENDQDTSTTAGLPHGYRKLAAGTIGGVTGTPVILWVVGILNQAMPNVDFTMPQEVAGALGALVAALFFYQTKEQAVAD